VPGFPERKVEAIELPKELEIEALPEDTPELELARLLDQYRSVRLEKMARQPKRACNQFELLITQLQQRLLSSIEAFTRTPRVHCKTMELVWAKEVSATEDCYADAAGLQPADSDDERALVDEAVLGELLDREAEKATLASASAASSDAERQNNTTGGSNTATGANALLINTTCTGNTAIGISADINITTASNVICIGADGANVSGSCFIGNIRGVTTAITDAIPVLIDSAGQLGTTSSSARFKNEIKPMDKASEAILALKPVTFHYKNDTTNAPQFGLIAEEVADVTPDLVMRDVNGKIPSPRSKQTFRLPQERID
jgi:hypothetical protein